jgi:hypothetical protein
MEKQALQVIVMDRRPLPNDGDCRTGHDLIDVAEKNVIVRIGFPRFHTLDEVVPGGRFALPRGSIRPFRLRKRKAIEIDVHKDDLM